MDIDRDNLSAYKAEDHLPDGRRITIRAIHPTDKKALLSGFKHISAKSAYQRFFQPKKNLTDKELAYLTEVDFDKHVALVSTLQINQKDFIVGSARYIVSDQAPIRSADVAFIVGDPFQGLGIGKILLRHLVDIARISGVKAFQATVLAENRAMLKVFSASGLTQTKTQEEGVVQVTLSL
jgi:RimJ/RimL family protein N-acetyltransferase